MDFSQYSPAEQAQLQRVFEKKQMTDFIKMYSGIVEKCFVSCCNDFTSKSLSAKEDACISNCADKLLKHAERVGARFAEQNADAMKDAQR